MKKQELEPLIPLDRLKKVVAGLVAVPKAKTDEKKAKTTKQPQRGRRSYSRKSKGD